jgi:hypothetical protein
MRKILGVSVSGLIVILVTVLAVWTYLGDIQASANDLDFSDTLDLRLNGGEQDFHILNNLCNLSPGDSENPSLKLENAGGMTGSLDIRMSPIVNTGARRTSEFADGKGDLGGVLEAAPWIDLDKNGVFDRGKDIALDAEGTFATDSLKWNTLNSFGGKTWVNVLPEMTGGSVCLFFFSWRLPKTAGNNIQGDSTDFETGFDLKQIVKN